MLRVSRTMTPGPITLDGFVEGAGRALACAFSSADEYEAALIAERRAEGRYGRKRHRKRIVLCAAAIAAVLVVVAAVL